MLIDVPMLIYFDCENTETRNVSHAADHRVFTLRYDSDPDADTVPQYCVGYPPKAGIHWTKDEGNMFFDLFTEKADKLIRERAAKSPEDFCADQAEGKALQEAIDQERIDNGAQGVGA